MTRSRHVFLLTEPRDAVQWRAKGFMRRVPTRLLRLRFLTATIGLVAVACGSAPEPASEIPALVYDLPPSGMTVELLREPVPVGDVTMETLDGQTMSTRDWQGKVTLVNFWATWCGPCREEIPDLIKLQERYRDQLLVVGISTDEGDPSLVQAFADEMEMNYPVVMATDELNRQFPGVFALPTSFVVDPQGRIVQTHVGLISPAVFEQEVRHLTSLPTTVTVDLIDENETTRLANAAHATEIPGLDLSELTPSQKEQVLQRLNEDGCPCGCSLTLAQCRINDSACGISPPLARKVVAEVVESTNP
jgi:thiol-disulfide isomerase/thioredoxin